MIERALIGLPSLLALAVGAALAGGVPAVVVAVVAVVAAAVLTVAVLRPGWADGPTLVAAGLIVEVAVADERAWWRALIAALLLVGILATGETAQTGASATGWHTALGVHRRAGLASLIGTAAMTGAATAVVHDATVATLLVGIAAAAALLTLLITRDTCASDGSRLTFSEGAPSRRATNRPHR